MSTPHPFDVDHPPDSRIIGPSVALTDPWTRVPEAKTPMYRALIERAGLPTIQLLVWLAPRDALWHAITEYLSEIGSWACPSGFDDRGLAQMWAETRAEYLV